MSSRILLSWFFGVVLAATACSGGNSDATPSAEPARIREGGTERPAKLIVGLTPFLPEPELRREFAPLLDYLGAKVGLPVEILKAESYVATTRLFTDYKVHVAVLAPFAYVRAKRDHPDLILLATHIADGSSTYASYIVSRDDAPYNSVEDLRGKRFMYNDRASASGYLYPLAYMQALGIVPEKFFRSLGFAGNHQKVIDSVLKGDADAGAVASTVLTMMRNENPEARRLKILAKTGRIPYDAYCASPRLDQALVDQLRAALLDLSTRTEEGRRVLQGLSSINGFVAVGDDHYDEVRRVARMVEGNTVLVP